MKSATSGATSVSFAYDALGRRVRRTQGTQITKFTYDGLDVVMDDVNGTLTKYQNGPGIDNKLKLATGNTPSYFLTDHLGSTNALTNASGVVTSSATYDSFGNQTGNLATRYSYTGREYDSFTGLNYYRNRWYSADIGRFVSEDPIGFKGGDINLYGYVKNNPAKFTDPLGLQECTFGVQWLCDWYVNRSRAYDDMKYDEQLIKMTDKIAWNIDCLKKNSNGLFLEINKLARQNYKISATVYYGQVVNDYDMAQGPIPREPTDLIDVANGGVRDVLEGYLSGERAKNVRKIHKLFRDIMEANRRYPEQCGCRIRD